MDHLDWLSDEQTREVAAALAEQAGGGGGGRGGGGAAHGFTRRWRWPARGGC